MLEWVFSRRKRLQHGNWTPFAHITGVKCCVPQILSKHGINRKADRGISKVVSERIVNTTGKFVPVGRSNNCPLLVWKKIAPAIVRGNTAFIHNYSRTSIKRPLSKVPNYYFVSKVLYSIPLFNGAPLLSGQFSKSPGWPLNRGPTVAEILLPINDVRSRQ